MPRTRTFVYVSEAAADLTDRQAKANMLLLKCAKNWVMLPLLKGLWVGKIFPLIFPPPSSYCQMLSVSSTSKGYVSGLSQGPPSPA